MYYLAGQSFLSETFFHKSLFFEEFRIIFLSKVLLLHLTIWKWSVYTATAIQSDDLSF